MLRAVVEQHSGDAGHQITRGKRLGAILGDVLRTDAVDNDGDGVGRVVVRGHELERLSSHIRRERNRASCSDRVSR
ncbi:hypothetical protein D3C72_1344210 [compost metagenome]